MEYRDDDRWLFGPDQTSNKLEGWSMVLWLVGLVIVAALLNGCDSQAAEFTAKAEQEAHERHQATVAQWWYSHTYAPIKASQANVTITVCQQTDSTTNWDCHAGSYK